MLGLITSYIGVCEINLLIPCRLTGSCPRQAPDFNIPPVFLFLQETKSYSEVCQVQLQCTHTHRAFHHFSWAPSSMTSSFFLTLYYRLCFVQSHVPVTPKPPYSPGKSTSLSRLPSPARLEFYALWPFPSYDTFSQSNLLPFFTQEPHRTQLCLMSPKQVVFSCFLSSKLFLLKKEKKTSLASHLQTQTQTEIRIHTDAYTQTPTHRHLHLLSSVGQNPTETTKRGINFAS